MATEATVRLGDASVRFDRTRWQASVLPGSISFAPQGKAGRDFDPVELHVVDDDVPCAALAERAFGTGDYDLESIDTSAMRVGGVDGERFATHTGCRNATPRGVVACIKFGSKTYLLQALQPGCGGRNLFNGPDPLAEIADGISFVRE
jgi:hypothetical protein